MRTTGAATRIAGFAYTAGVVVSFLALGGLMLALRAAGEQLGWGFQLQSSPAVVAVLAALLFTRDHRAEPGGRVRVRLLAPEQHIARRWKRGTRS